MNLEVPVTRIMTPHPIVVEANDPLTVVQQILTDHKLHHLPVVKDQSLVGIISKSDLLFFMKGMSTEKYEAILNEARMRKFCAKDIMSKGVVTINSAVKISQVIGIFYRNEFHALPVVDNGNLVGIVTTHDLIQLLMEETVLPS